MELVVSLLTKSNKLYRSKCLSPYIYFSNKEVFIPGTVLITKSDNEILNFVNPSPIAHGAILFGTGLYSYIKENHKHILSLYPNITDDVPYVIDSDVITRIVDIYTFISSISKLSLIYYHENNKINREVMFKASRNACKYIGKYYSLKPMDEGKYCFEIIVLAYKEERNRLGQDLFDYFGNKFYLSSHFLNPLEWVVVWSTSKKYKDKILFKNDDLCSIKAEMD